MDHEGFFIRSATPDDATAIDIILSTYFLDRDDMPYEDFFVAEISNKIIGCGVFEKIKAMENEIVFYEIHTIAVLPAYKNKGYGKKLLERLISEIKNRLMPSISNTIYTRTTAPDFFVHLGFSRADPALKKQLWEECVVCRKYETCVQTLLYKEI
ncbi:MAG: GNAT family N-acetyltransferase [Methanimicrococcus sp.]|nr:GNAT family N-acetyltransferase [Methanimicrococcus sp.]